MVNLQNTHIIGFGHKARRGKDTAVKAIIDARGEQYDIRRYAFADELKREVTEAVEKIMKRDHVDAEEAMRGLCAWASEYEVVDPQGHHLTKEVPYDPNPPMDDPLCPYGKQRTLLQWWGTEYRRWANPFYWVERLHERVLADAPLFALVSDMRFKNEMAWVKGNNGDTVRVDRQGYQGHHGDNHPSEVELDSAKYDYEINVEDGNVEELKKDAVYVFDLILDEMTPKVDGPEVELKAEQGEVIIRSNTKNAQWHITTVEGTREVTAREAQEFIQQHFSKGEAVQA